MVVRFVATFVIVGLIGGMLASKMVGPTAGGVIFLLAIPLSVAAAASKTK